MQGELLALLYLHPESEYSLTEAAAQIGASVRAVHHEVGRLVDAGLVQERRQGNLRLVRAGDTRLSRPLTELLALTYGPMPVLARELSSVAGIEEAYVFGAWARRFTGEPGPPPADVDVLVIGTADLDDLDDAARRAEKTLLRPVNVTRVLPHRWADPAQDDGFLADVRGKARVRIELGGSPTAIAARRRPCTPAEGVNAPDTDPLATSDEHGSVITATRTPLEEPVNVADVGTSEAPPAVEVPDSGRVDGMTVTRLLSDAELQKNLPLDLELLREILRSNRVGRAWLFGSRSRGDHGVESDIDLLYRPAGGKLQLREYGRLVNALQDACPVPVDLADEIADRMKPYIENDLVRVL